MNNRPTPETDKLILDWYCNLTGLPNFVDIARKFERERDEAREQLRKASVEAHTLATSIQKAEYPDAKEFELLGSVAGVISQIDNMYAGVRQQRDEWRKKFELSVDVVEIVARLAQAKSERDEAREERDWAIKQVSTLQSTFEDLQLKMLSEQAEVLQKIDSEYDKLFDEAHQIRIERDEAREDASHWKIEYEIVEARLCGGKHERDNGIVSEREIIPKLQRERDEARADAAQLADRLSGLELRTSEELAKMEQECNEANQKLKIATEQWELCIDLAKKYQQERDEWKYMAAKLFNIASYALGEFDVKLTLDQQRNITETMREYHSLLKKK
jgi:hypothetical protein